MPLHRMTITIDIEHTCDSTIALEEAIASCLCSQEHTFSQDDDPEIEFRIARVEFGDGGSVDCGRSIDPAPEGLHGIARMTIARPR